MSEQLFDLTNAHGASFEFNPVRLNLLKKTRFSINVIYDGARNMRLSFTANHLTLFKVSPPYFGNIALSLPDVQWICHLLDVDVRINDKGFVEFYGQRKITLEQAFKFLIKMRDSYIARNCAPCVLIECADVASLRKLLIDNNSLRI